MTPGAGRDDGGLNAGTTRSMAGDRPGSAEVHGGLHAGGSPGGSTAAMGDTARTGSASDEYGALSFSRGAEEEGLREKATNRISGALEDAKDLGGRATELVGQARERAGEMAGEARERMTQAMGQAEDMLRRSGAIDRVKANPMPALGIAFGVGYLLAGSSKGVVGKAKGELKHAVLAGLTATVAREARDYLGSSGGGMLSQFLGGQGGGQTGRSGSTASHRPPSHREQL
ncbi:MAG: hypothetical protein JWM27_3528 [Gemmatimonadetes bacterium]|nr:hypothetical protein [Gemmatimonadota bacterium]